MFKYYRNKAIFTLMTSYLAGFLILNLYFFVEEFTNLLDDWDR